jgi:hypothetical protein
MVINWIFTPINAPQSKLLIKFLVDSSATGRFYSARWHAGPMARIIRDLPLAFSVLSRPDAFSTSTVLYDAAGQLSILNLFKTNLFQ